MRWAVLLAGGSGTRFWPLSTPQTPKQLLPLSGAGSTAEEAVERLTGSSRASGSSSSRARAWPPGSARCSASPRKLPDRAARRVHRAGADLGHVGSPAPRPDAEVLSLHADWAVGDAAAFRRTADVALATARTHDRLVTVGVVPSRPETGYGYIVPVRRSTAARGPSPGSPRSRTPPRRST